VSRGRCERRDAEEGCSEKIGREEPASGADARRVLGGGLARVRTQKKNHLHGNSKPGFQSIKGCTHAAAHTEGRNK